jgi:hypothetical protein
MSFEVSQRSYAVSLISPPTYVSCTTTWKGTADLSLLSSPTLKNTPIENKKTGPDQVFWFWLQSHSIKEPAFKGKSVYHSEVQQTSPLENRTDDFPTNFAWGIASTDQPLAERVLRAFTHAIRLCGGAREEPF